MVGHQVLTPADALETGPLLVEIPAHEGVLAIAERLYGASVIRSRVGFVLLAVVRGSARQLKAGEYELARGASTFDVLTLMESGRVKQHVVLHPEGATVAELARVLESERLATSAAVTRLASDRAFLATLTIEGPSLEGYLFPDTYQFVRGMTTEEILTRMVQRLRTKLGPDLAARAQARGLSVHRLLTLSSIIEREAAERDEMRTISAVFWNRLKLDMPLQADPTVQYATGKERRALTRADLRIEHPFNTYVRPGLPPGPIASPGLAAIEAALDPAPVKYLYFVARDDHRHYFSATLGEHNAAVARYRLARAR
ncbi:MAG: endolytic transglycosylase MltG [Candidatus Rokuibacteriota bacterium]|nr:MAG: endolytic transglycosylase MltG [Candidatus Rokubacteria bacterium]